MLHTSAPLIGALGVTMTKTEMKLTSRFAPLIFGIAATPALVCAVITGSQAVAGSRAFVYENRIEVQVSQALKAGEKGDHSTTWFPSERSWTGPGEGPEGDMCREELHKLYSSADQIPSKIATETASALYQINLCHFFDPRTRTSINLTRILAASLGAFAGTLIGLLLWVWICRYKHVGWSRLSIASGGLTAVVAAFTGNMSHATLLQSVLLTAIAGTAVPSSILATRELVLWIRHGFSNPSSDA